MARKELGERTERVENDDRGLVRTRENYWMRGKAWEHGLPLLLQSWIRSPTPLSAKHTSAVAQQTQDGTLGALRNHQKLMRNFIARL